MDKNNNILDELKDKGDGMTVPEGYFEDFARRMSAGLPFREELDQPESVSLHPSNKRWQHIRPYVYMAAMFAGAWCLLKTFSLMSGTHSDTDIHNYPVLSNALENEQFVNDYVVDNLDATDIYDALYDDNVEVDEKENDAFVDSFDDETDGSADPSTYILPTDAHLQSEQQ